MCWLALGVSCCFRPFHCLSMSDFCEYHRTWGEEVSVCRICLTISAWWTASARGRSTCARRCRRNKNPSGASCWCVFLSSCLHTLTSHTIDRQRGSNLRELPCQSGCATLHFGHMHASDGFRTHAREKTPGCHARLLAAGSIASTDRGRCARYAALTNGFGPPRRSSAFLAPNCNLLSLTDCPHTLFYAASLMMVVVGYLVPLMSAKVFPAFNLV
jgi:hypothetical protein